MKKIFFISFLILWSNMLFAQNSIDSFNPKTNNFKKNAVFVEFGGSSFTGLSANYEISIYNKKSFSYTFSPGLGYDVFEKELITPYRACFNWRFIELGVGLLWYPVQVDMHWLHFIIGLKLKDPETGVLFRATFTSYLNRLPYFGGVSFGYCF